MVSRLGLEHVGATAETALYRGRSLWAQYWRQTALELRPRLAASGHLNDRSIDAFLARCEDPGWWTQTIAFTAVDGRAPRRRRLSAGAQDGLDGPERGRGT
jgi:hypothetical protein